MVLNNHFAMKKNLSIIALVAVAATALVSCTKGVETKESIAAGSGMKTITIQTGIATKTTLDANHENLVWSANDKISIFNDVDNTNLEAQYTAGGDLTVQVPAATTKIYAHYPYFNGNSNGPSKVSVYISNSQKQTKPGELNGYNFPMVAKGTVKDNKAFISLYPVAGALALNIYNTELAGEENVLSVTVTPSSDNTGFIGRQTTNITGDNIAYTSAESSNPITVTLTNPLELGNTKPADKQKFEGQIYVCLAKQSYANVTFEIQTTKGTYTITSNDTAFDLENNDFLPVNINLANAQFEASEELSGTYVILAEYEDSGVSKLYAMANTHSDNLNRLDEIEFAEGTTATDNRTIVWNIAKSGDGYTITDLSGKYLTASSSNDANVGTSAKSCAITKNADGTYYVTQISGETTRYLSRNNSNSGFAFYSNTNQNCKLSLVKIKVPVLTWGEESIILEAADEEEHEVTLTAINATSVSVSVFDEDETTAIDWLVADYADGKVTYMAEANTSDIRKAVMVATATNDYGTVTAKINVTQKADNSHVTKGETWSYTFSNTDFAQANASYNGAYNGLILGFKSTLSKLGFDSSNSRGVQFGAAKGLFTITVSGYEEGIESIKLVMSSNAASNTISATVGGKAIGSQVTLSNDNNYDVEFSGDLMAGGDIVFSINDITKSVYLKSITINPGEPASEATPLVMGSISCDNSGVYENSLTFSWNAVSGADGYQVSTDGISFGATQNERTYTLSGLDPGTSYSIWVKAIGDGTNYTTSEAKESASGTTKTNGSTDHGEITIDAAALTDGVLSSNGFTLTFAKNSGSTEPTYNTNGNDLRLYAKGTVVVNGGSKTITNIVFNLSTQGKKRLAPITANVGTVATQTTGDDTVSWSGSSSSVTFTVGDKANYGSDGETKAGQLCFSSVTITY